MTRNRYRPSPPAEPDGGIAELYNLIASMRGNAPLPKVTIDRCACWLIALSRRRRPPWTSARSAITTAILQRLQPFPIIGDRSRRLSGNVYLLSLVRCGRAWRLEVW